MARRKRDVYLQNNQRDDDNAICQYMTQESVRIDSPGGEPRGSKNHPDSVISDRACYYSFPRIIKKLRFIDDPRDFID